MPEPGTPALFLIPSFIGDAPADPAEFLPDSTIKVIRSLKYFVVENEKSARSFLKAVGIPLAQSELLIEVLDKHAEQDMNHFLRPISEGHSLGLLSEAGCPAVADPGSLLVEAAHRLGIKVRPLTGPSSLLLALMASGMNGQSFSFKGYLPIKENERAEALRKMTDRILKTGETQIVIETPYRNESLLQSLIRNMPGDLRCCLAVSLQSDQEWIRTLSLREWKKVAADFKKKNCVFVIGF